MADEVKSPSRKKRRSSTNLEEDDGGFKFTRQSRRTMTYYKGSSRKKASTKKKRRSSFVHGRKERKSLAPPSSKINLHQNIPVGLPPTARLRRLFHASLELAITKIKEQPNTINSEEYPDFTDEAQNVFAELQKIISDSDIIDEAFQQSSQDTVNNQVIPNPINQQHEESVLQCQAVSQRLNEENIKWDVLLESSQTAQEQAKQELQEYCNAKNGEECPDFLSSAQHKLLSGKPVLKTVIDKLENIKQTSELQVGAISQSVSSLKQFSELAETSLQRQIEQVGAKSLQVIQDMGTPRTLLQGQKKHK